MRMVQWLFVVSAALFICGIGLVIVGARAARQAPSVEKPATTPVATVKQLMNGVVSPASKVIFSAVSTTVTDKGIVDVAPTNDAEWDAVGDSAAALAEAGNLMMTDGRAVDQGDWIKMARAMVEAGRVSLKAVEAKNPDELMAAGEVVNISCDNCHQRYQRN